MKTTLERPTSSRLEQATREWRTQAESAEQRSERWARWCALAGTAMWAAFALSARMGIARVGAIEVMFALAPLVIAPLGMEVGRRIWDAGRLDKIARRSQPAAAVLAVAALLLPPGKMAGLFACAWLAFCLLVAGAGIWNSIFCSWSDADRSVRATLCVARVDLAVGACWLVASRFGIRPLGIQEPIGLLTAVHFHFAGFATATITAAALQFARRRTQRWFTALAAAVVTLPFVVAAGFVVSPVLKMAAAVVFSISIAGMAVVLRSFARQFEDPTARLLLQTAAGAVFAGMVLSGAYAVADLAGSDVLTIPQMARTHGILNAVGFCLPGLLGWAVEGSRPSSVG